MTIKDFNDFLSTAENLYEQLIVEGVHDKSIFKAVFLNGGPGSGKDYVLNNALSSHGLIEIHPDRVHDFLYDPENPDKVLPDSNHAIKKLLKSKVKNNNELRQHLALYGRNGLLINGAGDDVAKYTRIKKGLEDLGYETAMVGVHSSDDSSKQRNIERGKNGGRIVPEKTRKSKWDATDQARPKFAKLFGQNYHEYDNSDDLRNAEQDLLKSKKDELTALHDKIAQFTSKPPSHPKAKAWINGEISKPDTYKISNSGLKQFAPKDSKSNAEAIKSGLQYYGSGRYGTNGQITHHSVNDKLIKSKLKKEELSKEFENFLAEAVTISITGDTAEEIKQAIQLLTSDNDSESEQIIPAFSNPSARNLLTLGKSYVKESIDFGIETGMAMSGWNKEKLDRNGKVVSELTGDETTASIGDQKEDELKKKGISLQSFKAKNFM